MSKKRICLDAGHYGKYNRSPAVKSYYESDMAWKLHLMQKKYLEGYGIEVILTREDQDTDLGLTSRGKKAKGCDLFISDHSNAVGSGINESVDYPVVYVPINGSADEIGKRLAQCIEEVMGTTQNGRISERQGSRGDYYGVIRGAVSVGVPGMILEHSFHTNTKATNWLLDDDNLDKLARAEAKVIAEYLGINTATTEAKDNAEAKVIYRVQVGAYSVVANAKAQLKKVQDAGFPAFIFEAGDGKYRVQVGAYSVKANAEAQLAKVKAAGFEAFISAVNEEGEVAPSKAETEQEKEELTVDGKWGKDTTERLQEIFGTPKDGIVSNQHASYKDENPGLTSGWDWDEKPNGKGSSLIEAMQEWAGMPEEERDGEIGPKTIKAFQKKLGTTQDGKVSNPSAMVKALQKWANAQ